MRWYRDAFCQEEVRRARELDTDPYQLMNEQAAKVPAGSYGMMCAFSDVMNYIAWRHAAPTFTNFDFDPEKFNKYTFYRAIMENTAMVTRGHLELVREATGKRAQRNRLCGRGPARAISGARSWPTCWVCRSRCRWSKRPRPWARPSWRATAWACFRISAPPRAAWSSGDKTFTPNAQNHQVYERMYGPWREMYKAQLKLADDRVTRFMWAAPGL